MLAQSLRSSNLRMLRGARAPAEPRVAVLLNANARKVTPKVIRLLGQARARMVDGTPKQPLDGKTVETVFEPPWYIQVASIDGSLLAFDHPSFGPLAFAVPRSDITKIVRILNEHLALPATQPDKLS